MLAKFISLNAVIRGYICVPIWRALKSVSHSNLLFLATLLRQTSELESKNLRISVSTTHDCVSKKKNSTTQQRASSLGFFFFFRGGSWQHKLLTTSYSSPPGANDTASQADGVAPVLHHQSSPVIKSGG